MDWVHVPTPGDHYSPATGSAVMTVIYEMSRVHAANGGRTRVLVSKGTRHDYPVGECVEVPFSLPPKKWQKVIDVGLGWLGFGRHFGSAAYRGHAVALPRDFAGTIFLHNNPAAIRLFRRRYPMATVCLWAHNELFGTYGNREANEICAATDRVICVSHYIARELRSRVRGRSADGNIRILHNGVDVERFRPLKRVPDGEPPLILFVGRVQPLKGPDLLLKAARLVHDRGRRFRLRIVGSSGFSAADPLTSYEQELRRLAEPMRDIVQFQPFVDRDAVLDEYRRADLCVVPSNWNEPLGLTVLEAMACGIPTIASHLGGIPEVGEESIFYFTPPDLDELARHLICLVDDVSLRTRSGEAARAQAMKITWINQYRSLVDILSNT